MVFFWVMSLKSSHFLVKPLSIWRGPRPPYIRRLMDFPIGQTGARFARLAGSGAGRRRRRGGGAGGEGAVQSVGRWPYNSYKYRLI